MATRPTRFPKPSRYSESVFDSQLIIRNFSGHGVPVSYRDAKGQLRHVMAQVIDFNNPGNNRFVADRDRLKDAGRGLLASMEALLKPSV